MGAYDTLFSLSDAQAVTAAAASTNYIDMEVVKSNIGVGGDVFICVKTNTTPTDLGDTLSVELQCDSGTNFSTPKVWMLLSGAVGAELTVTDARTATGGSWIYRGTIPYECDERYVRLYYNNTTSNGTITLDAWLQTMPPLGGRNQVYLSNVSNP